LTPFLSLGIGILGPAPRLSSLFVLILRFVAPLSSSPFSSKDPPTTSMRVPFVSSPCLLVSPFRPISCWCRYARLVTSLHNFCQRSPSKKKRSYLAPSFPCDSLWMDLFPFSNAPPSSWSPCGLVTFQTALYFNFPL